MAVLSKGNNFPTIATNDLLLKVKGHSALATLSNQAPLSFNGNDVFTFTFDSDIDIVAENGAKSHGGLSIEPVKMTPIKVEYGARVSDEFMYGSEEIGLEILRAYNEGFSKKLAEALDKMAMHGINPRTGAASTVIGTNHLDAKVTNTVDYGTPVDAKLEAAIELVEGGEFDVTGIAIAPAMRTALAAITANGAKVYPEFAFGGKPASLGTNMLDVNRTVSSKVSNAIVDYAIVGDYENAFKWGIAKEIPVKVIEYGDPDNTGVDLAGHNQVYLRSEVYLGWAILDGAAFARVVEPDDED